MPTGSARSIAYPSARPGSTEDQGWVAATTDYGSSFAAVLARDRIFAVQFHPEKSQRAGLQLLETSSNGSHERVRINGIRRPGEPALIVEVP